MEMQTQMYASKMSKFLALNQGAVKLYDECISKTQDMNIKNQLQQFRMDHQNHIQQIQQWFQQAGQQQMQPSTEFKNFDQVLLQTARIAQGQDDALKAMHVAEGFVNAEYGEATHESSMLPQDIKQVLQSQLQTEHAHLYAVERWSPLMQGAMAGGTMGGTTGTTGGGSMGGGYGGGGGRMGGY